MTNNARKGAAPEFSRPFVVDTLGHEPERRSFDANEKERNALAERLELQDLGRFRVEFEVRRQAGGMIRVAGDLSADVVQTCVVTLEPVSNHVSDRFVSLFAPPSMIRPSGEIELNVEEDDPEPLEGGVIDLGEVATQHLSLALDPYPRAPGVAFEPVHDPEEPEEEPVENPFAKLARLNKPH
ncbi:MAG TPA: DUF177 domain-containing protein [Azospirillaceae bacterium]|nr:DUF177 domain-containing protein [Azospirillaceae bacterium]